MGTKRPAGDAMARVRAVFKQSGISLIELGRRMGYPDETARQSAWQFMKTRDPRLSMVRRFADAMGIPLDDLTPERKGKRMSRKLEDELEQFHCEWDAGAFREMLEENKSLFAPSWTVDELVCHPDEAKKFCNAIRSLEGCAGLPDDLILRTLMNVRRSH
jgi:transcriptional regulator with XRE-family HTH domain